MTLFISGGSTFFRNHTKKAALGACYDSEVSLVVFQCFLRTTGLLNLKSSQIKKSTTFFFLHFILVVYLGHRGWDVLSYGRSTSFIFLLQIGFWEGSQAPKLRTPRKRVVGHSLYRSIRPRASMIAQTR